MARTARTKKVPLPKAGITAHFTHRDDMARRGVFRVFRHAMPVIPPTILPVDSTGNAKVSCPMDGNDTYGDCGEAMACHVDNIWTFGQGKPGWTQSFFSVPALEQQYLQISGGDNGMDESMLVGSGGVWRTGLAGVAAATVVDALDIDLTNAALLQFAIDNFYAICMAWSVPDTFVNDWVSGSSWLSPAIPDPNNGHYTPLADVDAKGNYRLFTWGGWSWVSPQFVASVQPQGFVAFSARQFSPSTGLDSKGRHITAQAGKWVQCGGNPISPSVLAMFPPASGPVPQPTPTPSPTPGPPPTPAPPDPTPGRLFGLSFPRPVRQGASVSFRAPVAIPAGSYDVDPSTTPSVQRDDPVVADEG